MGFNGDIDTAAAEDIIPQGGTYVWMSLAGQRLEVVSTGAQDTGAGTGVQQVLLGYLDTSYVRRNEIITLTGGVAAPTVANNIIRVNRFRAYRVGGNYVAAGDISCQTLGGGTIYSRILTGQTRARQGVYTVPAGSVLYVTSGVFVATGVASGKNIIFAMKATYEDETNTLLSPNFFMPYAEVGICNSGGTAFLREFEIPIRFPSTVDLKVSGTTDANDAICRVSLRGYRAPV